LQKLLFQGSDPEVESRFILATNLYEEKNARVKSLQDSNVAMRIQIYVNIKEENVEE
jgi:hypothetical protein